MLWVSSQGQVCLPRDLLATAISCDLCSKLPPPTLASSSHLLLCSPPPSHSHTLRLSSAGLSPVLAHSCLPLSSMAHSQGLLSLQLDYDSHEDMLGFPLHSQPSLGTGT